MKLPQFITNNLILKITSLNSVVVGVRLLISLVVQNLLAQFTGQAGIAKVGQIRNLSSILMSLSSLGVFNGVVKYVSEYKNNEEGLKKLFSTVYVLSTLATLVLSLLLFFGATDLSVWLFFSEDFTFVFQLLAVTAPFIAMNRIFYGVISGLKAYKVNSKIEIIWYSLASILLLFCLYSHNIEGVLFAIAITPIIQFLITLLLFGKTLSEYVKFRKLNFETPMFKVLLGYTLISFVATVCSNLVDIDFRTSISEKLSENEAGIWTAMSSISKIYMQFLIAIFSLYILPKYAEINSSFGFRSELKSIYKSLLPLVVLGMLIVYFLRELIVLTIYNEAFLSMTLLFKWQLLADFMRFIANVMSFKFLAKKQISYFIYTQLLGLLLYHVLGHHLIETYKTEGVVMGLFVSNLIYLGS
ncbi:MAG: oligosaccharide flippase family protein, partial [Flavobacteriaceae bacterium]